MQLLLDFVSALLAPAPAFPCAPVPAAPAHPVLRFVRHPKARRYIIRIDDRGDVRVTVPKWGSKREAAAFAERERAWIDQIGRAHV